jgi:membrane carboxypeptidase/penicillin-binding protein PbpC
MVQEPVPHNLPTNACRRLRGMLFFIMKPEEIKGFAERQPFRPFAVRLNNGTQYTFKAAKDIGAPKDYHLVIYFGTKEAIRIDTDSIVEIFER